MTPQPPETDRQVQLRGHIEEWLTDLQAVRAGDKPAAFIPGLDDDVIVVMSEKDADKVDGAIRRRYGGQFPDLVEDQSPQPEIPEYGSFSRD